MFRILRLAVVPLSLGLIVTTGVARAEDDRTFSERISEGFFGAIRGTNMDNRGIDYRERSPLVVPPSLDLPPPASAASAQAPNWPKDPDERQRKALIAAKKKNAPPPSRVMVMNADGTPVAGGPAQPINIAPPPEDGSQPVATARPAYASDRNGTALTDPVYDQGGDLLNGGLTKSLGWGDSIGIGNLFGGKGETVAVQPGTEPARQALTQPPAGYQTPSTNYAYGLQPKGLLDGQSNPDRNPLAARSSATSMQK